MDFPSNLLWVCLPASWTSAWHLGLGDLSYMHHVQSCPAAALKALYQYREVALNAGVDVF